MTGPPTHSDAPSPWRTRILLVGMLCFWGLLAARLIHLQWWGKSKLAEHATRQRSYIETIPARPGEIVDRNGRLLATTVVVQSLYIVPSRIESPWQVAKALSAATQQNPDSLFEKITSHRQKQFLWIKRRLTESEANEIRKLELPAGTWGFRDEYARRYPQGIVAAHVLGLRDIDGIGRGGLEQSLDHLLRGQQGQRVFVRDARGRVIDVHADISRPSQPGQTLVLTIDTVIQLYVERQLDELMQKWKPKSCSAIVMDPQTAEILAMASRPTFDPNNPGTAAENAWKNQAISSMYEPGSTYKPLVVAHALEKHIIARDEMFDCEQGAYRMGNRILHDHHSYGTLSLTDILVKSSNIGMAKIGERMTNALLHETTVLFGFGRPTGIELPGELSGMIRPLKQWNSYSTGSIPMGQELAVTPIQLITAHAALAHGGILTSPRLVLDTTNTPDAYERANSRRPGGSVVSQTVGREVANWVVETPMVGVVKRGTGKAARIPGYTVFGKTGTAQKPDPETGQISSQLHVSSFLCGAPASNPRLLVLVVVDEPSLGSNHFGGTIAAPSAANILRRALIYLRIPPDSSDKTPSLTVSELEDIDGTERQ